MLRARSARSPGAAALAPSAIAPARTAASRSAFVGTTRRPYSVVLMDALVAFAAALLALRLAGNLARRWRRTRRPELACWAWSLAAYAVAAAASPRVDVAGWGARAFRRHYAARAPLSAPLPAGGSLPLS